MSTDASGCFACNGLGKVPEKGVRDISAAVPYVTCWKCGGTGGRKYSQYVNVYGD